MYTLFEVPENFKELNTLAKSLAAEITRGVDLNSGPQVIPANTDLLRKGREEGDVYLLQEGSAAYRLREKVVCVFDDGDLLGLEGCLQNSEAVISSEFAVIVKSFKLNSLLNACRSDAGLNLKLHELQQAQFQQMVCIISELLKADVSLSPEIKTYSAGETIIEQNVDSREVYTLVEGQAEAFVDGVKVGEVLRDEIFGMIAAFTGTPRTATVKAATNCLVLSVPNDKFIDLINSRPQTVLKLLEDMSRLIVGLNKTVVELKG